MRADEVDAAATKDAKLSKAETEKAIAQIEKSSNPRKIISLKEVKKIGKQ